MRLVGGSDALPEAGEAALGLIWRISRPAAPYRPHPGRGRL